MVTRGARSADVRADSACECFVLRVEDYDALGESQPAIQAVLLANLVRTLARTAARLTDEVIELSR